MKTYLVLSAWIATTVGGFWWYDGRYRLPVAETPPTRPDGARRFAVPGARVTLLSFYNPECGCSRFAAAHVADLARRYRPLGLRIVTVVEGRGDAPIYDRVVDDASGTLAHQLGVPAAPGAVVIGSGGKVVYRGGFNAARFCDDPNTAFAEKAISSLLSGKKVTTSKGAFYGCTNVGAG